LHQDWSFVDEQTGWSGLLWIPLVDVGPENGGLVLVPGSHRLGVARRGSHPWPDTLAGVRDDLQPRAIAVEAAAGDAVVYDNRVVHGSTSNRSHDDRPVLAVAIAPRDAALHHHTVDPAGRTVVAEVADDYFLGQELGQVPAGALPVDASRFGPTAADLDALA
ncbi:hypothetical protein B7486_64755, partial [cyanobacterium TDX16]